MSIRIMSAVWGLDLPDSEMLILLALADWSNDDGECWPSIAQLVKKTRKSERTIQGAIKSMERSGHLSREQRPGKGCRYRLHPQDTSTMQGFTPPEFHYLYRITAIDTGEFYVGARTCVGPIDDDDYMGSGLWVRAARKESRPLTKVVLATFASRAELAQREVEHTREVFGLELCRNAKVATAGTLSPTKQPPQPLPPATSAPRNPCAPQPLQVTPATAADNTSGHTTSPKASPSPKRTRARSTDPKLKPFRLPADWKPSRFADGTVAREVADRRGREWSRAAVESFRLWAANAEDKDGIGRKLDWQAALAKWIIEQDKRDGRSGNGRVGGDRGSGDRTLGAMQDFIGGGATDHH